MRTFTLLLAAGFMCGCVGETAETLERIELDSHTDRDPDDPPVLGENECLAAEPVFETWDELAVCQSVAEDTYVNALQPLVQAGVECLQWDEREGVCVAIDEKAVDQVLDELGFIRCGRKQQDCVITPDGRGWWCPEVCCIETKFCWTGRYKRYPMER